VTICPSLSHSTLLLYRPDSSPLRLSLSLSSTSASCQTSRISVSYCIVNRTGLPLLYAQPIPPGYAVASPDVSSDSFKRTNTFLSAPGQQQEQMTVSLSPQSKALPVWADDAPWYTVSARRFRWYCSAHTRHFNSSLVRVAVKPKTGPKDCRSCSRNTTRCHFGHRTVESFIHGFAQPCSLSGTTFPSVCRL
jgi:hypothetical protein